MTNQGVNWIIKTLRQLGDYNTFIQRAITNLSTCAAIAGDDLKKGQKVGLEMRDGLLYASASQRHPASGTTISAAQAGEDVGITGIEGIVPLEVGRVTILRVPGIRRGGSKNADLSQLRTTITNIKETQLVAAIGLEALIALKRLGTEPACFYGVKAAVVEAAYSGLSSVVVCVNDDASELIRTLEEKDVSYELLDAQVAREST